MKTATNMAWWTLLVTGVTALLFELMIWTGNGTRVAPALHVAVGYVVVFALWTLAFLEARDDSSFTVAGPAAAWGALPLVLGVLDHQVDLGRWQWVVRVLYGVSLAGCLLWGFVLARRLARVAAAPRSQGLARIGEAAAGFLAKKRVAVTGVSRTPATHGSNLVYRRLRERGYEVFAINPNTDVVEGDRSFPDLKSIPGGVEAVVIATHPTRALPTMRECAELGIAHVWMHRSFGIGSVSDEATRWGREHGIVVIDGGCPLMFDPTADEGHKMMRGLLTLTGKVPRRVS